MSFLQESSDGIKLFVTVKPNSSKSEIVREGVDSLIIKLKAQPKDNEANIELIKFLSKFLKIPKTNIILLKGNRSKNKTLLLASVSLNHITDKLNFSK